MMSMNLSNIAFLIIKNADYCCIIIGISKTEAIKLLIIEQLCYKFIGSSNLIKSMEIYKLKKNIKVFESMYENRKNLVILKSKNKNFTNIKNYFNKKY